MILQVIYLFFIATAFGMTDEEEEVFIQNHKTCVASSGVEMDVLERAYEGEVSENEHLKKYFHCFFVKSGFQNKNGEMLSGVINRVLPRMVRNPDEASKTIIECEGKKLTGANPEETAFLNFKCYIGVL